MTVASMMMAMPVPMPNIWMKLTLAVPKARNDNASRAAAVVTIRPARARPVATAWVLFWPESWASLILDSRKTS